MLALTNKSGNSFLYSRKSNVKSFIKKGVNSCKENQYANPQTNAQLQMHLLSLKKSCSELIRQVKVKEQESAKFRDVTSYTVLKCQQIREIQEKLEKQMIDLKKSVERVNCKKDEASHCSKTYENILQRMKKDEILLQFKKNTLERQLMSLQKFHQLVEAKSYSMSEFQQLAKSGLRDAYLQIQQQRGIRSGNFRSIENQTRTKRETQNKLEKKQKQTEQIRQLAADDIQDADLIKLKKFMNVQLFLKQLLKQKMLKLKQYYEPIQQAFFKIKSNTKVRDAISLKNEFLNYQQEYTHKTIWVKNLQIEIVNAEQQRKKLKQRLMESEICQIEFAEKPQQKQSQQMNISKRQMGERSEYCQLLWQRIQVWMTSQGQKMSMNIKNTDNIKVFAQICQQLKPKSGISSPTTSPSQNL